MTYPSVQQDEQQWISLGPQRKLHVVNAFPCALLDTEVEIRRVLEESAKASPLSSGEMTQANHSLWACEELGDELTDIAT